MKRDEAAAAADRQLRLVYLQPGPVSRRVGQLHPGVSKRPDRRACDPSREALRAGALTGAVHAERGRNLHRGNPKLGSRDSDPRRVPGTPGDWPGLWRQGGKKPPGGPRKGDANLASWRGSLRRRVLALPCRSLSLPGGGTPLATGQLAADLMDPGERADGIAPPRV